MLENESVFILAQFTTKKAAFHEVILVESDGKGNYYQAYNVIVFKNGKVYQLPIHIDQNFPVDKAPAVKSWLR